MDFLTGEIVILTPGICSAYVTSGIGRSCSDHKNEAVSWPGTVKQTEI